MTTAKPYPTYNPPAGLDAVGELVYRSNLLGSDQRVTNTGGGNTSAKLTERDPITGTATEVLWVKGSGGDLRTAKRDGFASLYQQRLIELQPIYANNPAKGVKTPVEDAMVGLYPHCTFNLNPRPASIDTPLHSFVPAKHVDHMHPNSVIAICATRNAETLMQRIWGDDLVYMPWCRPGFELGLRLQDLARANPTAKGAIMGQHGVINWADSGKACYELTIDLIRRADEFLAAHDKGEQTFGGQRYQSLDQAGRNAALLQILPWLRGAVAYKGQRLIATVQDDEALRRFVNSVDAPRLVDLGTSCPDHFLRTKIKPLYVAWDPQHEDAAALKTKLASALDAYRAGYAAYYQRCKRADSPAMRNPNPTVILIPGIGMVAFGKDKSESRVTAEFYNCAVEVIRGAESVDEYIALSEQEAFEIEYWALEEAKLKRMPAEKELARQVVAVIGAGSGIGREVALRMVKEGAQVVCVDLKAEAAQATAREITDLHGLGIGVGGSGISGCGPAFGTGANITDRASIQAMLDQAVLAYGGIDHLVVTAGYFASPDAKGHIPDQLFDLTFAINVKGQYYAIDECFHRVWKAQGLSGSAVICTSVNAVVSKKGMVAYDTSKAAANHLVRELAIELSPLIRVNAVAPATVVEGSSMFPRDRVISSLAKYEIPFSESEDTEALRSKLAGFYAQRTLLKKSITPADQAEGIFLLVSNRLGKTTGQVISIDGGLHEAFMR